MGSMGESRVVTTVRSRITRTTNSGPATDYEERPPVEPFVPSLEVKNRCQPDFSDLIGKSAKEAERIIQERRPDLYCEVIPHGTAAPPGVRFSRVRLFLDRSGNVSERPIVM